jgi:hypothetical protein
MRSTTHPGRRALALLAIGALGACGGGDGGGEPTPSPSVLEQLGVPTNDAPRADVETLHPLVKRVSVFQKRSELYVSGMTTDNASGDYKWPKDYLGRHQVLLDDATSLPTAYAPLFSSTAEDWTAYDAASTAADLDGDGREEVVVLYRNGGKGFLRIISQGQQSEEFSVPGSFPGNRVIPDSGFNNLQLSAGDLDDDGSDEVAAVAGGAADGDRLLVLDWSGNGFTPLADIRYREGTSNQLTTVAVGNVDGDPRPEIVVVNGVYNTSLPAHFYVYSWTGSGLTTEAGGSESLISEAAPSQTYYRYARVAIGDLDADNLAEIAFVGNVGATDAAKALSVTVIGWDPATGRFRDVSTSRHYIEWSRGWMPFAAAFDADGVEAEGGKKELLAHRYVLHLKDGKLQPKWPEAHADGLELELYPYFDRMAVGDFTGDGRDDVAYIGGPNDLSNWMLHVYGLESGTFQLLKSIDFSGPGYNTTLCAANVDDDSLVLRYTGEYELRYTQPDIVAVLASPPYYAGQDVSNASTTFGLEQKVDVQVGAAGGLFVGVSFGTSVETPLWGSGASVTSKATVEAALGFEYTRGSSLSATKTLGCPAGENQVVFSATPVDAYYYEVVRSPDPAQVGTGVSILIPREPKVLQMELGKYNAIVPEPYRVPGDVLKHTMGVPRSYPSESEMRTLFTEGTTWVDSVKGAYLNIIGPLQGGFRTPDSWMANLTVNNGFQQIELSEAQTNQLGANFTLRVEGEIQVVAAGVLVGGKAGWWVTLSTSVTTTDRSTYGATLMNIPESMSDRLPYSAGLMVYPYPTDGHSGRFIVVNFWVE